MNKILFISFFTVFNLYSFPLLAQDAFSYWKNLEEAIKNKEITFPPLPLPPGSGAPKVKFQPGQDKTLTAPLVLFHCPLVQDIVPHLPVESILQGPMIFLANQYYKQRKISRYKVLNEFCLTEITFYNSMNILLAQMDLHPNLFDIYHPSFIGNKEMSEMKVLVEKVRNSSQEYIHAIHNTIKGKGSHPYSNLVPTQEYFSALSDYINKYEFFSRKIIELARTEIPDQKGKKGKKNEKTISINPYQKFLNDFLEKNPAADIPYHHPSDYKGKLPSISMCFDNPIYKNPEEKGLQNSTNLQAFGFHAITPVQRAPRLVLMAKDLQKSFPNPQDIDQLALTTWKVGVQEAAFIKKLVNKKVGSSQVKDAGKTAIQIEEKSLSLNELKRQFEINQLLPEFPFLRELNKDEINDFFSFNTPKEVKKDYANHVQLAAQYGLKYIALTGAQKTKFAEMAGKCKNEKIREFSLELLKKDSEKFGTEKYNHLGQEEKYDFMDTEKTSTKVLPFYFKNLHQAKNFQVDYTGLSRKEKEDLAAITEKNEKKLNKFYQDKK